jgi:hypothetical protein
MGETISWNEHLGLELPDDPSVQQKLMMVVQAWDEDVGVDELIGQGVFAYDEITEMVLDPGKKHTKICKLTDNNDDDAGSVELEVTFKPHKDAPDAAEMHGRLRRDADDDAMKVARAVDGTKWMEGDPILGHFDVKIVSATGLDNPVRGIAHANEDPALIRKAAFMVFCYFATGAAVFNLNCVTEDTHGDNVRWTFVDTVYFGIVTITTTGYGDLLPNHNNCNNGTMVFTCFYAFIGVGMIASALGFMVGRLLEIKAAGGGSIDGVQVVPQVPDDCIERVQWLMSNWTTILNPVYYLTKYLPDMIRPTAKAFSYWMILKLVVFLYFINNDPLPDDPLGVDCNITTFGGNCSLLGESEIVSPSGGVCDTENVGSTCTNFCVSSDSLCIDNVQHNYLPALDAVYMISVSLTSVGYGDFSPSGQPARTFTIFWLMLGTLLTAKAWGSGADLFLEHQRNKIKKKNLNTKFDAKSILKIDEDGSGAVNETEFLAHMLVKMSIVDNVQLADIRGKFKELDVTGDGFITSEDLVDPNADTSKVLEVGS